MKSIQPPQDQDRSVWLKTVLLVLAAWCVAWAAADGIGCLRTAEALQGVTAAKLVTRARQKTDLEAMLAPDRDMVEAIKKKNFYVPPPPKRNPVSQVNAIVGDQAFINGRWLGAGATIGDAKLLEVFPTYVTVEWNGQKKTFSPLNAPDSGGPRGSVHVPRPSARLRHPHAVTAAPVPRSGPPPGMFRPTPEDIEKLKHMSREEREVFIKAHMQH